MKKITGGVTAAKGFEAAAAAAGIKYENRTDMALVYSVKPVQSGRNFTNQCSKGGSGESGTAGIVESKIQVSGSDHQLRNRKCLYRRRGDALLSGDCESCSRGS